MTIKPISPTEVGAAKAVLHPIAIAVFNDLITRYWNGERAVIKQEDVVQELVKRTAPRPSSEDENIRARRTIFEQGYLNIEEVYRAAGWTVKYDRPGWDENYPAIFTFTKG